MDIIHRERDKSRTRKLTNVFRDLHSRFDCVSDWRTREGDYPLPFLLTGTVACLTMGANDIASIENMFITKSCQIHKWLGLRKACGFPSDRVLLQALCNTSPTQLLCVVTEWSEFWYGKGSLYAIDGKANRAALLKCNGKTHSPYILNAFSDAGGCIAAQLKISEKKNEISVIKELFKMLEMRGALITTDAFATNADVIREALYYGADCLMPLKDNQAKLHAKAADFIEETMKHHPELISWYEDTDNDQKKHGRHENRKTGVISKGVRELINGSRFEGLIAGVAIISRDRTIDRHGVEDLKSNQTLIYLFTRNGMTAKEVAMAARGHWAGCEMIHYVLDTEFDEDHSTIRTGYSMENMSCLRKSSYSILRWIKSERPDLGSYHLIRDSIRDYGYIPKLSNKEHRTLFAKDQK